MTLREIEVPDGLIKPSVRLVGEDGNAFAIMSRVQKALKRRGNEQSVIDSYTEQSMAGDYDHLLRVALAFTDQDSGDVEGYDDD
jgi:hypothetical protein